MSPVPKKLENDNRLEFIFAWYLLFSLRGKWKIDGPYDDPDGWLNKSHGLKENSLQYAVQKVFVVKSQDNRLYCFVNFCRNYFKICESYDKLYEIKWCILNKFTIKWYIHKCSEFFDRLRNTLSPVLQKIAQSWLLFSLSQNGKFC